MKRTRKRKLTPEGLKGLQRAAAKARAAKKRKRMAAAAAVTASASVSKTRLKQAGEADLLERLRVLIRHTGRDRYKVYLVVDDEITAFEHFWVLKEG